MEKQPLWTRDFICICLCNLFVFITYYTLVTTLPLFVLDVLQGRERETGLVVTSLILAAVLFRPISGKWVDERGKKNVLLISAALYFTSSTMYLGMQSLLWLLALRFLHGISFSLVTTAMGADCGGCCSGSPQGRRNRVFCDIHEPCDGDRSLFGVDDHQPI